MFLDFGRWDELQTFENQFSPDFEQEKKITIKKYAKFILLYQGANYEPIWPELTVKTMIFFSNKHGTSNNRFDSKIWPYGLIFHPHVEENEYSTLLLLGHPRRGGLYKSARGSVCMSS